MTMTTIHLPCDQARRRHDQNIRYKGGKAGQENWVS